MTSGSYLRFPHVRGDQIAFVAQDDIWVAGAGGGQAYRVSADQLPAKSPRLSPSGEYVAWTAGRTGSNDVFVAATEGGLSRQLTFWGQDRTFVRGWLSDSEILVLSTTGEADRSRIFAHAVPLDGSPSRRLPYGWAHDLALGPDGGVLISTSTTSEPAWWKHYRGGTAAQLWLDRNGSGEFSRLFAELRSSLVSPIWVSGASERIGFLSDHEGRGQLYSAVVDEAGAVGELVRHTDHEFYARHASSDGTRVAYVAGGSLWLFDSLESGVEPRQVPVRLSGSRPVSRPALIKASDDLAAVRPDHTGRASVLESRGTVSWLTHRDGPVRTLAAGSGSRHRLPVVLGQTGRVAWVTDSEGDDSVVTLDLTAVGAAPVTVLAPGLAGRILEMSASPDGRSLAVATHDGRLLVVGLADDGGAGSGRAGGGAANDGGADGGREPKILHRTEFGDFSGLAWSPDSEWLAWSEPSANELRHIQMARPADGVVVEVTPVRFKDTEPAFTADGAFLAFLSVRSFDPVYDSYSFDLSFPLGCRPQLVALSQLTPPPFGAQVLGRGWDEVGSAPSESAPGEADAGGPAAPRTQVDVEGLQQRLISLPVEGSRYENLRVVDGGLLWLKRPLAGELGENLATADAKPPAAVLERFSFGSGKLDQIADSADAFEVSGDRKRLTVVDSGAVIVLPTAGKADKDSPERVEVDLARVRIQVQPTAEWTQMFQESWRLMRDHFWRPDMGGLDWDAMRERYAPLLPNLGSLDDLVDLIWELNGELGTSHAYCLPKPAPDARPKQGLLGADLSFADGRWKIDRLVPGEASDRRARSPLTAPGVGVRAGDAILAVDGRQVSAGLSPNALLLGAAEKPVELLIGPADGGDPRRVVVVPLADEFPLRYQDWVADRRAHVHLATEGKVGYLHIPDMVSGGWAQLHRDLPVEMRREALIVDVRGNRGGHTSQLVIQKLARQIIGWGVGRGVGAESYPTDARRGPMVAVADMHAGSDGDIVTAAIKAMQLGPVVGSRTWGGVIGIDMRYHLIDGTSVTQPRYATWFEKYGWDVENYGVDPDVEVIPAPHDRVARNDRELDTAIELVLQLLAEQPALNPPELPPLG